MRRQFERKLCSIAANYVFAGSLSLLILITTFASAHAESGFSGLFLQGIDKRIAAALGQEEAKGVLVRDVALDGPAALAGVRRGDLIVKYAGTEIETFKQLVAVAQKTKIGQEISMEVIRAGKPVSLALTLGQKTPAWKVKKGAVSVIPSVGLTFAAMTPKIRKRFGVRWGATGIIVTLVDVEYVASQVLERGDIITQINQHDVWKPEQLVNAYKEARDNKRARLLLLVERYGNFQYLLLPVKE